MKNHAFYKEARTRFISLVILLASFLLLDQKLSIAPLPSISFECFFLGLTNKEIQSILMRLFVSDANVSSMRRAAIIIIKCVSIESGAHYIIKFKRSAERDALEIIFAPAHFYNSGK